MIISKKRFPRTHNRKLQLEQEFSSKIHIKSQTLRSAIKRVNASGSIEVSGADFN